MCEDVVQNGLCAKSSTIEIEGRCDCSKAIQEGTRQMLQRYFYTERQTTYNGKENNRKERWCWPCIALPFPLLLSLVSALKHHLGNERRMGWEATIEHT